jgi:hypothetical protein
MGTCNVLLFAANPNGVTRLALEEECREIDQKIRAADYREELQLITKWAVRPDDLLQYLNQYRPQGGIGGQTIAQELQVELDVGYIYERLTSNPRLLPSDYEPNEPKVAVHESRR